MAALKTFRLILYRSFIFGTIVLTATLAKAQKANEPRLQPAKLFVTLPDYCPTPDAFAIAPDGSLTLSCPNYADAEQPGVLMKITPNGEVLKLAELPGLTEEGSARPTGIAYASDGSLFVCDNQGPNKGRLLRVTFNEKDEKTTEIVAYGLNGPNGVRYHNGALYVTTPKLPKFNTPKLTSGIYRFKESDRNIKINNDSSDSNLIFTTETQNPHRQFGLDGLVFNQKGQLLVGDFGDGHIFQLSLSEDGRVMSKEIYAKLPNTAGIDGMCMDENGTIYIAGFSQNQIFEIDKDKNVTIIAQYPDNNGAKGAVDQPADLILYDGKLIISNFDLMVSEGMINTSHSKPYTLSYIDLGCKAR